MTARQIIEAEDPKSVFRNMKRDDILLVGYDEDFWHITPRELEQLLAWNMAEPSGEPNEYNVPGCFEDSEVELALAEIRSK